MVRLVSERGDDGTDEVVARRARIRRVVVAAKRVGYLALVVAIVAFFVGLAAGLPGWSVTITVVALVTAIVVLPLPIVLGYGIRAAERDERREERRGPTTS
jgi:hypothetical protein